MGDGRVRSCAVFVCCDEEVTHEMFYKASKAHIQIVTQIRTLF